MARTKTTARAVPSGTVTKNASPGTVTKNASPGKVTKNASPGKVTKNASPGKVTKNASPGKVTKNASPGKVTKNASSGTAAEGQIPRRSNGGGGARTKQTRLTANGKIVTKYFGSRTKIVGRRDEGGARTKESSARDGGRPVNRNRTVLDEEASVCPIATTRLGQCRLVKKRKACEMVEPSNEWKAFHKDKKPADKPKYEDAIKSPNFLPGFPFPKTLEAKERLCAFSRARQRLEKGVVKPEYSGVEAKMRGGIIDEDIRPGYELRFDEAVTDPAALRGIEKLRRKRLAAAAAAAVRPRPLAFPQNKRVDTKRTNAAGNRCNPGVTFRNNRTASSYNRSRTPTRNFSNGTNGGRTQDSIGVPNRFKNGGLIRTPIRSNTSSNLRTRQNASSFVPKRLYEIRVTFPGKSDAQPDTHVVTYCGSNGRLYKSSRKRATTSLLRMEALVLFALKGACPAIQKGVAGFYGRNA